MHHRGPGAWVSMIMLLDNLNPHVDHYFSAICSLVHNLDPGAYLLFAIYHFSSAICSLVHNLDPGASFLVAI